MQLLVGELIAGLYFPITVTILGSLHILARIGFHYGYKKSAKARVPYAVFVLTVSNLMPVLGLVSSALLFFGTVEGKPYIHTGLYVDTTTAFFGGKD